TTTREVLRRNQFLRAQADRLLERLVYVRHAEVDRPVGRDFLRNHGVHVHSAGDALAAELELCVLRLAFSHRALLGRPAEHFRVELLRLVEGAGVQLHPREGSWLALDLEAVHRLRLPGRDEGPGRVLEDGHAAHVHDVERRGDHLATLGLDLLGDRVRVLGADVRHPRRGSVRVLRATDAGHVLAVEAGDRVGERRGGFSVLRAPDAGHVLAVEAGDRVATGRGVFLRVGLPTEKLRVELARTVGI